MGSYHLYNLENEKTGYVTFKLSASSDLHRIVQDALQIAPACAQREVDDSLLITYTLDPVEAQYVYRYVELIAQDYADGIRLGSAWWEFVERGH